MELLLWMGLTGAASAFGYLTSRRFVRERLRFVDAVQKPSAPWLAGAVAALAAGPIAWLLPIVGGVSALAFGAGVGVGVRDGVKDTRRLPGY